MARVALVTGGSRGIGAAISIGLKNAGYQVAASYAGNEATAAEFSAETGIKTYKWDVADYDACAAGIAQVEADLGPVEILVNNAGITRDAPFHKMTRDQWQQVIDTNLSGVFNMTHPIWPGMRERKFGRIITISSINGQKGQFAQVNYAASKAGDLGITKSLAHEGARMGITANAKDVRGAGIFRWRAHPTGVLGTGTDLRQKVFNGIGLQMATLAPATHTPQIIKHTNVMLS